MTDLEEHWSEHATGGCECPCLGMVEDLEADRERLRAALRPFRVVAGETVWHPRESDRGFGVFDGAWHKAGGPCQSGICALLDEEAPRD